VEASADVRPDEIASDPSLRRPTRTRPPVLRAFGLVLVSAALEMLSILPGIDRLADTNPTIHFTQHGVIFLGGIVMGIALRDASRLSRR
jgi:hypothetical protein